MAKSNTGSIAAAGAAGFVLGVIAVAIVAPHSNSQSRENEPEKTVVFHRSRSQPPLASHEEEVEEPLGIGA